MLALGAIWGEREARKAAYALAIDSSDNVFYLAGYT